MTPTNFRITLLVLLSTIRLTGVAATLGKDAESAIPKNVQQLIVLDNRAMQNSAAARSLKHQVLPPELKNLQTTLLTCGVNVDADVDLLAFALFRVGSVTKTIGVAQGNFQIAKTRAKMTKDKVRILAIRNYTVFFLGDGAAFTFLDQTTMVFGGTDALIDSLNARDGETASMLTNEQLLASIPTVSQNTVWSLLDQKGTQEMMRGILGDAAQLMNYEATKSRFQSSGYIVDFRHGVRFELHVVTSDTLTGATLSAFLKGAALMDKSVGAPVEKAAINETAIDSTSGVLSIAYQASEKQFESIVSSALFKQVTR